MHDKGSITQKDNEFVVAKIGEFGNDKTFHTLEDAYNYLNQEQTKKFTNFEKQSTNYHKQNKQFLEKEGLSNLERKSIYRGIDDYFEKHPIYEGTKSVDIDIGGFEVSVNGFVNDDGEFNYEITSLTDYKKDMINLLKERGIEHELSNISDSIYFTYNDETYRISNHKRPMQDGYYDPTSHITHNIVIKNNKDRFEKLKKILEV